MGSDMKKEVLRLNLHSSSDRNQSPALWKADAIHNQVEKAMLKKLATVVAIAAISGHVLASEAARQEAKQVVELKDGSTLYIFRDGKMAIEDQYGQAKSIKPNSEIEAKDGQKYMMQGNEVGRLELLQSRDRSY